MTSNCSRRCADRPAGNYRDLGPENDRLVDIVSDEDERTSRSAPRYAAVELHDLAGLRMEASPPVRPSAGSSARRPERARSGCAANARRTTRWTSGPSPASGRPYRGEIAFERPLKTLFLRNVRYFQSKFDVLQRRQPGEEGIVHLDHHGSIASRRRDRRPARRSSPPVGYRNRRAW